MCLVPAYITLNMTLQAGRFAALLAEKEYIETSRNCRTPMWLPSLRNIAQPVDADMVLELHNQSK